MAVINVDLSKDEVELLVAQPPPQEQQAGNDSGDEEEGQQGQSGQLGQQSGNPSGGGKQGDDEGDEDSKPQTDDMPQSSDDGRGQQSGQEGQQSQNGQQSQSGQDAGQEGQQSDGGNQQSGQQPPGGQQSSGNQQSDQSGQSSSSGQQSQSGQQPPGQQSSSGGGQGSDKSANEREAEEERQAAKDALNRIAGVDNKDEIDKQTSAQAGTERGAIASDSPVTQKDIQDIGQEGKKKESQEETQKVDDETIGTAKSPDQKKRSGKSDKSGAVSAEIKDYYAKYAGFRSKLMDEEDTVSKLQQILADALSTKSTYDDTATRRDTMYSNLETGNRYFVLGAEREVTVPTDITLILDCSSSMSMMLFKRSMFAIVQILTKFDMALEVVHVITFGEKEALHGLLRFSGSGFHPKFFYNRVDQMYDAQSRSVGSGGTWIHTAYRHAQSKCKDSTLLFVFSDFELHDNEGSLGNVEYSQLKQRMRYFSSRTIYVKIPSEQRSSSSADEKARSIKTINAAMQDLDPSWLKRKCTLAEAARAYDESQK